MGDVGDVDADAVQAALQHFERECVVKVLGIRGVDGKCGDVAEIAALTDFAFGDILRDVVGLLFHLVRELEREVVFCEDGHHLHVVVARLAQNVGHFAQRTACLGGPIHNHDHHLVAVLSLVEQPARDDDVTAEVCVVGDEVGHSFADGDGAHNLFLAPLHHFHHLALGTFALAGGEDDHLHDVVVERVAQVTVGDEDILLQRLVARVVGFALWDDESHAAALHLDSADDVVAAVVLAFQLFVVDAVLAASGFEQQFGLYEAVNLFFYLFAALLVVDADLGRYLFVVEFLVFALSQRLEDSFG